MRFADALAWRCLLVLLLGAAGGCAMLMPAEPEPETAAAAAPARQVASDADVSPTAKAAFESSLRALKAGRQDEAERGLRALARSNPELPGPHANLAIVYRNAGKLPEATAELEQALRLSPRQPAYYNQLGIVYRQQGQFRKARDAYLKAIALDPDYATAHINLGILYDLYLWDAAKALEHYSRYLTLSPSGDEKVNKWVVDLKQRSQKRSQVSRKEEE
jgi:Flp pilus assembly protein TadD